MDTIKVNDIMHLTHIPDLYMDVIKVNNIMHLTLLRISLLEVNAKDLNRWLSQVTRLIFIKQLLNSTKSLSTVSKAGNHFGMSVETEEY